MTACDDALRESPEYYDCPIINRLTFALLGGIMKPRFKSSWILAGLVAITAMFVDGRLATAGMSTGIYISKAGSTPIGDPSYEYLLEITVSATGADPLDAGGSVMVTNLTGISPGAPFYPAAGTTVPDWYGSVGTNSATFLYEGAPIDTTVTYSLGMFYVGPTVNNLSAPPTPVLGYTGNLNDGSPTNTGTVQVQYFATVPEPSSAILMFAGLGVITLIWVYDKRRRNRVSIAAAR
jgi:hypothetical protein